MTSRSVIAWVRVGVLNRSRQFWILFGVAWWLCLAGVLPAVADGPVKTQAADKSRQVKDGETATKDNFRFQLFTIPKTPPRTPDDLTEPALKERGEEVRTLFNEWFLGKQIEEFIRFFEGVNKRQEALDREDLRAFIRFTIRLMTKLGPEINHKEMQALKNMETTTFDRRYHRINKKYEFQHQHLFPEDAVRKAERAIDPPILHFLQTIPVTWWMFIDVDENGAIRNIRVRVDHST